MARPVRKGLAYFPLDTDLFQNRKIQRLSRRYGCRGVTVYLALLCEIYGTNGYYIPYSDDLFFDLGFTLALDEGEVKQIADFCIGLNLFDKPMKEAQQILTSQSIQDRFRLVRKRNVSRILPAFCLTDDPSPAAQPENRPGNATAPATQTAGGTTGADGLYGKAPAEAEHNADEPAHGECSATADKPGVWGELGASGETAISNEPAAFLAANGQSTGALLSKNGGFYPPNAPLKAVSAAKTHPKGKEKIKVKGKEKQKVKEKKVNELAKTKNDVEYGTEQTDNEADKLRREELARMAAEATRNR